MILYLVGVNHEATRYKQPRGLTKENLVFIDVIESTITEHSFDLLAEEEQPECLIKYSAVSLFDAIHRAHGIPHEFVDPNQREREGIKYRNDREICGLEEFRTQVSHPLLEKDENCGHEVEKIAHAHEIAHQFPIRERFWLNELRKTNAQNILFVCGDIHLRTFPRLLEAEGIRPEFIKDGIGVDYTAIEYSAFDFAKSCNLFSQADCFCKGKLPVDQMD
ncbi:MAG TPA: hypothetical protein VMR02_16690 [Terracidiphilus sp.]|nr:hypothetical protein [Terracidiphilus sp.]